MYDTFIKRPLTKSLGAVSAARHMPDEIDEFSIQSWNVPMTVLDLRCLRAGSSTQPVRRHGSFLARSDVSWFEVWWGVPVPQNEGGLAPRFPKWGCRIDSTEICRPRPWSEFRTKVEILKMMRWRMGSQWSWSLSTGLMWSNFLVFVISLAAALRTDCNLRRTAFVAPMHLHSC